MIPGRPMRRNGVAQKIEVYEILSLYFDFALTLLVFHQAELSRKDWKEQMTSWVNRFNKQMRNTLKIIPFICLQ